MHKTMVFRVFSVLLMVLVLITPVVFLSAQDDGFSCPDAPAPRLIVGERAQVTEGGLPNRVRSLPNLTGEVIGNIPPGDEFDVLDGPTCGDGYVWWQVDYAGMIGWTAEGTIEEYWLEAVPAEVQGATPIPAQPLPRPDEPTLNIGETVRTVLENGRDRWVFEGQAGDVISIRMTSTDFDAFVQLLGTDGRLITVDDDSAGGTDAFVDGVTLPTTGRYTIVARGFSPNARGAYVLMLIAGVVDLSLPPTVTPASP